MTAQEYIDKIGALLVKVEEAAEAAEQANARVSRRVRRLHKALDEAQIAYQAEHSAPDMITPFSGGTNKPDKP